MHDIFVSYSREDRPRAEALAAALEVAGWTVWWDRSVPAGRTFDEVIEEAIEASRCVMVLWSEHSIASRWVRTEAQEGVDRGVLVPVLIDEVKIPLAFRRVQAANLTGWNGEGTDPAFGSLLADIEALVGSPVSVDAGPRPGTAPRTHETPALEARTRGGPTREPTTEGGRSTETGPTDGRTSWLHRHPRTRTGLLTGLAGGMLSGILGLLIFANDSRDFINPYTAALMMGAFAGVCWAVVGMAAGPKRARLLAAAIGASP
jgi:hypothetical protein